MAFLDLLVMHVHQWIFLLDFKNFFVLQAESIAAIVLLCYRKVCTY